MRRPRAEQLVEFFDLGCLFVVFIVGMAVALVSLVEVAG